MPLIEHIYELRDRLFKAVLGLVAGMIAGFAVSTPVQDFLTDPYCNRFGTAVCQFNAATPLEPFVVKIKIALYVGLVLSSPIWLYQLWAFITPGLHRHERGWAYGFVGFAAPLFVAGSVLAHLVVSRGLDFLLPGGFSVDIAGYVDFVIGMMLIFGVGFEFPLIVFMLHLAGLVTARKLLGWWRVAVFLVFVFAAVVTPDPSFFGMTVLGTGMSLLYFAAVGAAYLNERRRTRAAARNGLDDLPDDERSPLDEQLEPVEPPEPIEPVAAAETGAATKPVNRDADWT